MSLNSKYKGVKSQVADLQAEKAALQKQLKDLQAQAPPPSEVTPSNRTPYALVAGVLAVASFGLLVAKLNSFSVGEYFG